MDILVENKKLSGTISSFPSKSYAQRALFLSLLAPGESDIEISHLSQDIQVALTIGEELGFLRKEANRYFLRPKPSLGQVDLDLGESGTCLRLIIPILGVLGLRGRLKRQGSLVNRTLDVYKDILPAKGYKIRQEGPYVYLEGRLGPGSYKVPGNISSQFVSGLLMALGYLEDSSSLSLTSPLESSPYVDMTIETMEDFKGQVERNGDKFTIGGSYKPCSYQTPGDWSQALFFLGAQAGLRGLDKNSSQADRMALNFFQDLGLGSSSGQILRLESFGPAKDLRILDAKHMPDSVPILSIIAASYPGTTRVINTQRLRLKESDRVTSTLAMLRSLGVEVKENKTSFEFKGRKSFKEATIDSYKDHRISMSAFIASTHASGPILVRGAEAINKSYPRFFEDFKSLGGSFHVK